MSEMLTPYLERALGGAMTGLYQGLLVALGVWVALRGLRASNAATRHAVAFVALLGVAALPVVQALRAPLAEVPAPDRDGTAEAVASGEWITSASALVPGTPAQRGEGLWVEAIRPDDPYLETAADGDGRSEPDVASAGGAWAPVFDPALSDLDVVSVQGKARESWMADAPVALGLGLLASAREAMSAWVEVMRAAAQSFRDAGWLSGWTLRVPGSVALGIVSIWAALAGIRLFRLAAQYLALLRLRRRAKPAPAAMVNSFRAVAETMGVRRPVALASTPELNSPILVGCWAPTVLMPAALCEGRPESWEPMFIHELAHVKRGDVWTNLIQQAATAFYFFHPAMIWLSRRLAVEREIACDDHVLAAKGAPRAYALFLTEHARRMQGPAWVAAPAAWSNPSQLKERIHMLLDTQRNASPRLARMRAGAWTTSVLLLAGLAFYAAPRVSVAGSSDTVEPLTETEIEIAADATVEAESDVAVDLSADTVAATVVALEPSADVLAAVHIEAEAHPKVKVKAPRAVTIVGPGGDVLVAHPPTPPGVVTEHPVFALPVPHPTPGAASKPRSAPRPRVVEARPGRHLALVDESKGRHGDDSQGSLERRLHRLERMVESLVEQRGGAKWAPPAAGSWNLNPNTKFRFEMDKGKLKELGKLNEDEARRMRNQVDEIRKRTDDIVREAQKNTEEVRRKAREEAEKAMAKARMEFSPERREAMRRPIEEHRRALEREMKRMEAQMNQLESQLERLDEEAERMDEKLEKARELSEKEREEAREHSEKHREEAREHSEKHREERRSEERREELPAKKKAPKPSADNNSGPEAAPAAGPAPAADAAPAAKP